MSRPDWKVDAAAARAAAGKVLSGKDFSPNTYPAVDTYISSSVINPMQRNKESKFLTKKINHGPCCHGCAS